MTSLFFHYAKDSQIGIAKVTIFAWRCGGCQMDFHLDRRPDYCPVCGEQFEKENTARVPGERRKA